MLAFVTQEPSLEEGCGDVEVWEFENDSDCESTSQQQNSTSHPENSTSQLSELSVVKLVGFICTFMLSWQAVFRICALNVLFKFINLLLQKLAALTGSEILNKLEQYFPTSLFLARKMQSRNHASFAKFIACPRRLPYLIHLNLLSSQT